MSAKHIELNQAAEMLGVSPEQLNDMRLRGEIFGMRDGASWKFKVDEVERVAEERGAATPGAGGAESAESALDLEGAEVGGSSDLHLNFEPADADSPTAIGSMDDFEDLGAAMGSSADLADDEQPLPSDHEDRSRSDSSSDVALVADDDGSSVNLVAESGADLLGSDVAFASAGSDEFGFEGSDLGLASDVALDDKGSASARSGGAELSVGDDEELALDDDDELVLDGSGDVTGGSGDTGINLTSPSDSGLNLEEEPLDLAGSSVSSLELPEDDDIIDLDDLEGGSDAPLRADEDFSLTPSAMAGDDEEDSGSQVIALEDSEAFEEAATVLAAGEGIDEVTAAPGDASLQYQPAMGAAYAPAPEMPYSVYNIVGLLVVLMILALTGMLMADLVRNMGSFDELYTTSTSIMDVMARLFEP